MLSQKFKGILISLALLSGSTYAHEIHHLDATMQLEHEGFLIWYAKKQHWDEEIGLEINLNIVHTSGIDILNKKREMPEQWDVAGVGAVPVVVGSDNMPIEIIGIANDEAQTTDVLVRKNSDILKDKGWNEDYPNIYGDPDSIEGKTFFVREQTSSLYTLTDYLDVFDLTLSDVKYIDSTASGAVARLDKGEGEGAVIWSPNNYDPLNKGYKVAATAHDVGTFLPVVFVSDLNYAETHPRRLGKFLAMYDRVSKYAKKHTEELAVEYQAFLKKYLHHDVPVDFCIKDLKNHPTFTLEEQIGMFKKEGHTLSKMEKFSKKVIAKEIALSISKKHPVNYNSKTFERVPTDKYLIIAKEYVNNNYQKLPNE